MLRRIHPAFIVVFALGAALIYGLLSYEPPASSPGDSSPDTGPDDYSANGILLVAFHGEDPPPGDSGRITGTAIADEGGCPRLRPEYVRGDEDAPTMIFPEGYAVGQPGNSAVLGPDDNPVFSLDQTVELLGERLPEVSGDTQGMSGETADVLNERCPGSYLYVERIVSTS